MALSHLDCSFAEAPLPCRSCHKVATVSSSALIIIPFLTCETLAYLTYGPHSLMSPIVCDFRLIASVT
jgi:hypothetical protein